MLDKIKHNRNAHNNDVFESTIPTAHITPSLSIGDNNNNSNSDERCRWWPDRAERCCKQNTIGILLFLIGVWNNAPYVIMLAAAKEVEEGGVALVYIANILPGLLVKASGSYWFHRVSYTTRLYLASASMGLAFSLVALFSLQEKSSSAQHGQHHWSRLWGQLLGVALISAQCSLGEASMLAWAGGRLGDKALTWFASGTGLAGPVGFMYHVSCIEFLGWSLSMTCTWAVPVWALVYCVLTQWCLTDSGQMSSNPSPSPSQQVQQELHDVHNIMISPLLLKSTTSSSIEIDNALDNQLDNVPAEIDPLVQNEGPENVNEDTQHAMSPRERFVLTLSFWPYMIPLFVVYAAEYACQGGAWTAMGFPVESIAEREIFYGRSNWLYQVGVLFSRSSGTLFTINQTTLWILPGLQLLNLIFFYWTAKLTTPPVWYRPVVLYSVSLWTGLLGGAVYVHGYKRVILDAPSCHREFALATVSLAESFGVLVADIFGLFIQACLYQAHDIPGSVVQCPM